MAIEYCLRAIEYSPVSGDGKRLLCRGSARLCWERIRARGGEGRGVGSRNPAREGNKDLRWRSEISERNFRQRVAGGGPCFLLWRLAASHFFRVGGSCSGGWRIVIFSALADLVSCSGGWRIVIFSALSDLVSCSGGWRIVIFSALADLVSCSGGSCFLLWRVAFFELAGAGCRVAVFFGVFWRLADRHPPSKVNMLAGDEPPPAIFFKKLAVLGDPPSTLCAQVGSGLTI